MDLLCLPHAANILCCILWIWSDGSICPCSFMLEVHVVTVMRHPHKTKQYASGVQMQSGSQSCRIEAQEELPITSNRTEDSCIAVSICSTICNIICRGGQATPRSQSCNATVVILRNALTNPASDLLVHASSLQECSTCLHQ